MEEELSTVADAPAAPALANTKTSDTDLSVAIARAVEKLPNDRVRCRRVGQRTYRCNWLTPDTSPTRGDLKSLVTYITRDSRFLRATRQGGRLVIEDLTVRPEAKE
jgi:hypothetical protein